MVCYYSLLCNILHTRKLSNKGLSILGYRVCILNKVYSLCKPGLTVTFLFESKVKTLCISMSE